MMGGQGDLETDPILLGIDAQIATITINRSAKKNAVTASMWQSLIDMTATIAETPDIRVVILRGAGTDFSAGADIGEFETVRKDAETARNYESLNSRAFAAIRNLPCPTIAAIRGACHGGGFGLAASCDLRIATPDTKFSIPAAKLGLAYPAEDMRHVVWAIGPQLARYLVYSARQIDVTAARSAGFLLEICAADEFDARISSLAAAIAANAPLTHRATKHAINAVLTGNPQDMFAAERAGALTFSSDDYAEGRSAFRDKRAPVFRGR